MRNKEKVFVVGQEILKPNEIPSIVVYGENLPEAWENAVLATYEFGSRIPTQYDQEGDPESRDSTMKVVVTDPLAEPRIHKALPTGLDELYVYTQEMVAGVHDKRVKDGGWSYSYHDRLVNWPGLNGWDKLSGLGIELHLDQISSLVEQLIIAPHSRRAQAITWNPMIDATHHEPPCLQRVWCRVVKSINNICLLEMNTHWRSRDALKAAFMNMYALTELQKMISVRLSVLSNKQILPGRYVDVSDSFHLYGSYERRQEIAAFLAALEKRDFAQRTCRSDDETVRREFAVGKERLRKEADDPAGS